MDKSENSFLHLNEVNYTLYQRRGIIGTLNGGVTKEVTVGSWNGELRVDIRRWHGPNEIGRGISLNENEVRELRKILADLDFGKL